MYNYAYQIGNVVKIGMDSSDVSAAKQRSDFQLMANLGSVIYGQEEIELQTLWRRQATTHQEAYRLKTFLLTKAKDNILPRCSGDWLKASDDIVTFFKNINDKPGN